MSRGIILSTKVLDEQVQSELEDSGFQVEVKPFIRIEFTGASQLSAQLDKTAETAALVFTSANAVEAVKPVASLLTSEKVFCISGKTRDAVEKLFGKECITATADYGGLLAKHILASGCREVLFFCSNIRRDELPGLLRSEGIQLQEIIAYKTVATPAAVNKVYDAVLFFSPSAADSFFSINKLPEHSLCFAVGSTTAEQIRKHAANHVIIANAPTQDEMVNAVKTHLK